MSEHQIPLMKNSLFVVDSFFKSPYDIIRQICISGLAHALAKDDDQVRVYRIVQGWGSPEHVVVELDDKRIFGFYSSPEGSTPVDEFYNTLHHINNELSCGHSAPDLVLDFNIEVAYRENLGIENCHKK